MAYLLIVASRRGCLLPACAAFLALSLAARPGEDMAQTLAAQPRRGEGAGGHERLFRNLRIMVHAEVLCLPLR